ncbi:hypothetical protein ZYGR_0N05400 [Zygosaccharomyces rouxii]|uniref:ZYRO0D12694p n=2 Tax=Zygosaccharomyces rouxii TaxID=4956 RepID=C5DW82_ZYGRC|nr:uncharacterized protein ZYRO0D12694g [Zygosaccharomyces rouxii]KAH9200960.1 hypothetical protein LQ764DRAFT_102201 [Zygosaccharomyces rouxii]GAV49134.1 hypothetical protein ZYGR_0N05400 [Zygosaccharomyces rouxii]CAR28051.1 ZYRO0D12694p [Zygosaccharomyces rouxii]
MDIFGDSEEEDNNPFSGTNHLYASGIAAVENGEDDFIPKGFMEDEPLVNSNSANQDDDQDNDQDDYQNDEEGEEQGLLIDHEEQEQQRGEQEEEEEERSGTTLSDTTTQFEPYVSLTMSMANNVDHSTSFEADKDIQVIDAGEYKDPWGKRAIGYSLRFQGQDVIRRYSEFDTLRQALVRLLPTVVVPPIPFKHPLIKYFLSPLSVENDSKTIEKRKRMFSSFLNNCIKVPEIRDHIVFKKFLDPEYAWKNVLSSPPIVILPVNNLLAPPLNPTKPSPLHLLLPGPISISRLDSSAHSGTSLEVETQFAHLEALFKKSKEVYQPLHRIIKQHRSHFHDLSSFFAELGAYYNAFSLEDNVIANARSMLQIKSLSNGIEKIGHGFDVNYVSSEILVDNLLSLFEEPLGEILQFLDDAARILQFRKLKQMQYQIIEHTISKRENRARSLQESQTQLKRLENVLQKNAQESPTIAEAVKHIENSMHEGVTLPQPQTSEEQSNKPLLEGYSQNYHQNNQKNASSASSVLTGVPHAKLRRTRRARSKELEPHQLTETERQDEIQKLHKEIDKLNECFKLVSRDIDEVNRSSLESLQRLARYINDKWEFMLKNFAKSMVNWLSECLKAWKNARSVVDAIES